MMASRIWGLWSLLASAACNSAVVNVERASSGAVDRDTDFTPLPGTDGHYISLPAYPLPNCTDTLVYDKLVADMNRAVAHVGKLDELGDGEIRNLHRLVVLVEVAGIAGNVISAASGFSVSQLVNKALAAGHKAMAVAKPVLDMAKARLAQDPAKQRDADQRLGDRNFERSVLAAQKFAAKIEQIRDSLTPAQYNTLRSAVDNGDDSASGLVSDEEFDSLLTAATTGAFRAEDMHLVQLNYRGDRDEKREHAEFDDAASDFVKLAGGFAGAPCAASAQYRYFYGYTPETFPGVTWIDREQNQQSSELVRLARDVGIDLPDGSWPDGGFAFLHFTDVQIREPGAKLGGRALSHELKQLESSFEQDYEQEQNAMFVYDGIVRTANAEIELVNAEVKTGKVNPPRPPPELMIHTGDSADMGLQSEFDTFLTYTNRLEVPWYQALGNHDVLAFGNLKLSSLDDSTRPDDDTCHGWQQVPCTCTDLNTLMREEVGRSPDNRGKTHDELPKKWFTALPMLLKRICIIHSIASDWFVMDPDKRRGGNPVQSFVLSHCQGWHPRPGDGSDPPDGCEDDPHHERYAQFPHRVDRVPPRLDKPRAPARQQIVSTIGDGRCAIAPPPPLPTGDGSGSRSDSAAPSTSWMHGLDLGPNFMLPPSPTDRDLGYYCFQMTARKLPNNRRVWAVVLNTNTDAGAFGVFPPHQQEWLRSVLPRTGACRASDALDADAADHGARIGCNDLVLLFAHHPVYALYDQQQRLALTNLITTSPNVIGMFIGHHHRSGLRVIRPLRGTGGRAKWEIMGPSVIDYPQAAREITVKSVGPLGYIEVLTFSPHGTGAAEANIRAAEEGAIRDKCRDDPKWCPDGGGRILLPDRSMTFPRLFFRMPSTRPAR